MLLSSQAMIQGLKMAAGADPMILKRVLKKQ